MNCQPIQTGDAPTRRHGHVTAADDVVHRQCERVYGRRLDIQCSDEVDIARVHWHR